MGKLIEVGIYDERTGKGLLRHFMTRTGFGTGEVMVVLVINGRKLPATDDLIRRLVGSNHRLKSVILNINSRNTNVILGDQSVTFWGSDTITDFIGRYQFSNSSSPFFANLGENEVPTILCVSLFIPHTK